MEANYSVEDYVGQILKACYRNDQEVKEVINKLIVEVEKRQLLTIKSIGDAVEGRGFLLNTNENYEYLARVAVAIGSYINSKIKV